MATVTDPLFAFLLWFISRGTEASAGVRHTAVAGAGGAHRGGGRGRRTPRGRARAAHRGGRRGRRTARAGAGVVIVCLLFFSIDYYCRVIACLLSIGINRSVNVYHKGWS